MKQFLNLAGSELGNVWIFSLWLLITEFCVCFSPQYRSEKYYHLHFVYIATLRLTIQTISFSLMIEHRLDHWKGLHHFRLALIFDKAQGLLFHSVGRTSRSHNSRFKRSEAAKQMKPLIEAKYFGSTRRSLKLGSFQQSVSERTSFLSLRFVSNSIHLVTICLFFSFNNDHSILKT